MFGYKESITLSIMADVGKMESLDDVRLFGDYIQEEVRNLEDALVAEWEKQQKM
jgi:hypothetical protein